MDLYLRNATHEISLREQAIYPIDGDPIFEKPDFWLRTFPNSWCIDVPKPVREDGEISLARAMQLWQLSAQRMSRTPCADVRVWKLEYEKCR